MSRAAQGGERDGEKEMLQRKVEEEGVYRLARAVRACWIGAALYIVYVQILKIWNSTTLLI